MADTDIELSVGLDASDVKQSAKNLNKAIKEVFDGSVGVELNKNMQTLQQRMSQTASKAQALQEKMSQLETTKVPTEEYTELQKQIEKTEAQIAKMQEKWDRAQETGAPLQGKQLEQFRYDAAQLENTLEYAKQEMQELIASGKAFTLGSDTAQYQKLTNDLASVNNQSRLLLVSWDSLVNTENTLTGATDKAANSSKKLSKSWNETANTINKSNSKVKKFLSSLKMVVANLLTFGAASRRANQGVSTMNRGFAGGIKHMLRYALGISSLFVLFNKLRSAAMEGIKAFVLWEGENGRLNQSISSIMSSISTLKNNIGALVAPLINALAPAITRIIDLLSVAIQKIAMFIAALTGQKTIMTANKVQENYAASLDKTAKSAKKAEKALKGYLSPIDEINQYQKDSEEDTAGGAAGAAAAGFTEVPIDSSILDMIQKLKDMLAKLQPIIDYLKKSWGTFKQGLIDGLGDWKSRVDNIKQNLGIIKDALIDIFTDPRVMAAADSWFQSVMYLLGSLVGAALSIGLTIAQNLVGGIAKYLDENRERIKKHLISMFDIWEDINTQLAEFAQAFAYVFEAFGDENGQRVTAAIIGIFTDAFMGVSELVSKSMRDVIQLITQPFIDNKEGLQTALDGFLGVIATGLETVKELVDDVVDEVNEGYDLYIKPVVDEITQDVSAFVGDLVNWWNTDVNPILQEIMDEVKKGYEEYIKPVIEQQIKPLIKDLADLIQTIWETKVKPVFDFIKTYILPTVTAVLKNIKENVGDTMKYIGEKLQYFFDLLRGVIKFINGVFSGDWKKAWEGIKDVFKAILNGIIATFERGLNKIIDGLNKISIDVPWDWAREALGTDKIGFDVSHVTLPRLAQGAVIPPNKEFLAMLGDQKSGMNIETPLQTMVDAFKQAMTDMGGSQSVTLNLVLPDKRTIAQYCIEGGQVLQMSRGSNPFMLERG